MKTILIVTGSKKARNVIVCSSDSDEIHCIDTTVAGRICNNFLVDCALFDKSMKLGTGVDL